jgi:NADP-dependent 3-hydroxy acid dehydrogenase YdfG
LISGATGGMGNEIARLLYGEGCKLSLFARREEKLSEITAGFRSGKSECIYRKCDVKNKNDVKDAVNFTMDAFGRIDVAILTAGVLIPNPIQTFDSSIIKNTMDINFMGIVYFVESILPIMRYQRSGTIVATSTLPDRRGVPGWGAYGASKAALSWMMESLRAEAKLRYNINFITIKPGSVKTPMLDGYHRKGAISANKAAKIIVDGIKKERKVIQFPFNQFILTRMTDLFPIFAYDRLDIDQQKGDGYPVVEDE